MKTTWLEIISDWQGGGTSFRCQLLDLFCKADLQNQIKLASAFSETFAAWQWWQSGAWWNISNLKLQVCAACDDRDVLHYHAASDEDGYQHGEYALCDSCEQARQRRAERGPQ